MSSKGRAIGLAALSGTFFTGILACLICDLAITGTLTWSLYAVSSIVLAWLVLGPAVGLGRNGSAASLAILSILILPFLFLMSRLTDAGGLFMQLAVPAAILGIVYLWILYFLFSKLKNQKLTAAAVALLVAVPVGLLINLSVSVVLNEPIFDIWDIFSYVAATVLAVILLSINGRRH